MDILATLAAGVGLGLMGGVPGAASAVSMVTAGTALVGAMKKRPEIFGQCLALTAMPSSQGLYGFVAFFLFLPAVVSGVTLFQGAVILGAGILMAVIEWFSSVYQGQVIAAGINSMGSGKDAFVSTLVLAVFPELFSIFGLVMAILMQGSLAK